MNNKKSLLRRLLIIYVTLFLVLLASVVDSMLGELSESYNVGYSIGEHIATSYEQNTPKLFYTLGNVPLEQIGTQDVNLTVDSLSNTIVNIAPNSATIAVQLDAKEDISLLEAAFSSVGGSVWIYAITLLNPSAYIALIVLMIMTIASIRGSVKNGSALEKENIYYLRAIGALAIFIELTISFREWILAKKAAELLAGTQYVIDTQFPISYYALITGLIILFSAEVFAIGHNLSEEQKLTI